MPAFNRRNIVLTTLFMILMHCSVYSQDKIYVVNGSEIGYIDLADYTYKFVCNAVPFGDIAITPAGKIYGYYDALYEIDPVANTYTLIPVDMSNAPTFYGANAMVSDRDGNLYVAGTATLFKIDMKNATMSFVGNMSTFPAGDLCFSEGKLYMAAMNNVLIELTLGPGGNSIVSERVAGTMLLDGDVYGIGANENGICYAITTRKELALIDTEDATAYIIAKPPKGNIMDVNGLALLREGVNDKDIEICGNGIDDDHNGFTDDNDMACRLKRGLCTSESQEIFRETFGAGSGFGTALPNLSAAGYTFSTTAPLSEGRYTIVSDPRLAQGNATWKSMADHTGNPNGRMMVINAAYKPGEFYRKKITDLCGGHQYAISVSASSVISTGMNCGQDVVSIPARIRFHIEDENGNILGQVAERYIPADDNPAGTWKEYGMIFTLPDNVSTIQIVLLDDAPGGCGNDLAIDDIVFSTCQPTPVVSLNGDYNGPFTGCINSEAVFQVDTAMLRLRQPSFQWQKRTAANAPWVNIPGANDISYTIARLQLADAGEYRILITEDPNITCPKTLASMVMLFTVQDVAAFQLTPPFTACVGEPINLSVTPYNNLQEARWTYPNGDQTSGVTLLVTNTAAMSDAGEYTLKIRTTEGCSATLKTTVTVLPYETIGFTFTTSQACVGQPVQVQSDGSWQPGTWQWTASGNGVISQADTKTPIIIWQTPGDQQLTLQSTGQCILDQHVTKDITIQNVPTPGMLSAPEQVCVGTPLEMTVTGYTGGTIAWNITGNPILTGPPDRQQAIWNTIGTYTINYTVSGTCGSVTLPAPKPVIIKDAPYVSLVHDTTVCRGTPLYLQPVFSGDATLFSWQDGPFVAESKYIAEQEGVYKLVVQDNWGCSTQAEINVQWMNCGCDIFIPTAFSPNGDGLHDIFKPVIHCVTASYEFRIYNRWGQLIYLSRRPGEGWNGILHDGRPAETGAYTWVLEYKSYEYPAPMLQKGFVTLVK
ncbi:gliding motility-associated C-terminal domain-containing protein [Chitinophaga agri]|uniref:T9SS type B sorting domain-containing protein n=1 Tax=Chitinophaga agri TaxID=2703787 RepID=A0A6B9ZE76_9BACT|nr:gliding motility-associated C-terminal domain-containing protein [Chitinophaga agri]QHS60427.1 T9SS type B sorting domain-containing protein [Chitinophaga agri]